jgi:hypothetical protein
MSPLAEQHQMQQTRKAYHVRPESSGATSIFTRQPHLYSLNTRRTPSSQAALTWPKRDIEALWKAYVAFEESKSSTNVAKRSIMDWQPKYDKARSVQI